MDTTGTLLNLRQANSSYQAAYQIAPDLLMHQGEPEVDGAVTAPTFATPFWNLTTNSTIDFPNVIGHHDIQYDPVNHTFLTLQDCIGTMETSQFCSIKLLSLTRWVMSCGFGIPMITFRLAKLTYSTSQLRSYANSG